MQTLQHEQESAVRLNALASSRSNSQAIQNQHLGKIDYFGKIMGVETEAITNLDLPVPGIKLFISLLSDKFNKYPQLLGVAIEVLNPFLKGLKHDFTAAEYFNSVQLIVNKFSEILASAPKEVISASFGVLVGLFEFGKIYSSKKEHERMTLGEINTVLLKAEAAYLNVNHSADQFIHFMQTADHIGYGVKMWDFILLGDHIGNGEKLWEYLLGDTLGKFIREKSASLKKKPSGAGD